MIGVKKLQDFSKAMIGPVLYLPAIGLLIALFSMTTNRLWVDESSGLYLVGKFVSSMLWALMNHLGFLFCLGLASGLAKTRKAEAAFVAAMTWLMYLAANNSWLTLTHRLATGATNAQLYGSGQTFIFGFQVIDMGVFLGIILGCAVAFVHNRVIGIEFRGALSIYGNSKLVLIVMLPLVGMFAIATVYLWPVVELGISALTGFMKSFGAIGVFLYGFLNRFLIPTGLHHLIWSPFVFTSIGGQLLIDGQTVIGAKPIFLAEIARHPVDALSDSARFLTYGMVKIFGTAGMALAFYRTAKPENKQRLKVTLIPLIVTSVLVGITEPFEFLFIFLPAGVSATRWPVFVALGLLETATMYLVGTFCITRLRLLTPGRETAAEDEHSQQANSEHPDKGALVIAGLGGKENVCAVGNCFTRLRVDVRDPALIQQTLLKESGGSSVLIKGNHVQVIYGLGVNKIRTAVNASLGVIE